MRHPRVGLALLVLCLGLGARRAGAEQEGFETKSSAPWADSARRASAASFPWRERAVVPYGMLSAALGPTVWDYELAIGDGESTHQGEGQAYSDAVTLGIQYAFPLLPFLSIRGYAQRSSFHTELSRTSGLGSFHYWDFGIAPTTGIVLQPSHGPPAIISIGVPFGYTTSFVDGDPPRDAIAEQWKDGHGFRIGALGSATLIPTRHVGITTDLFVTHTQMSQPVEFRALDGSGRNSRETFRYSLLRTDLMVGLVWIL